jgi:hypothetical protein
MPRRASDVTPTAAHRGDDPKGYQLGGMTQGIPSQRPIGAGPPGTNPAEAAMNRASITMPVGDAASAVKGAANAGRMMGARQAVGALANAARRPMPVPAQTRALGATPPPRVAPQGVPAMAKGGRTKNFHPGGHKGKLHREMGIPEGQTIPAARLEAATHSPDPEKRRDAIRAETMKKWHHG